MYTSLDDVLPQVQELLTTHQGRTKEHRVRAEHRLAEIIKVRSFTCGDQAITGACSAHALQNNPHSCSRRIPLLSFCLAAALIQAAMGAPSEMAN